MQSVSSKLTAILNFISLCVFTGRAVALHYGKAHVQSHEKWRILTPNDIKILKINKFELDVHDYVPEIYTVANFHFNPFSRGFSPDR